jgi:hypothetical protein
MCTATLAIWQTTLRANDAAAAASCGLLLALSVLFARYALHIPFASGSMVYFVLLGLFHLGLAVPWALGIYDISRTAYFDLHGISRSISFINYSIVAYVFGLALASNLGKQRIFLPPETAPEFENPELYTVGCILLIAGAAMFIVGLIGLDPLGYFRLTYSETFRLRAESDPRLFGSGMTISSIGLSIAAAGASRRRYRVITAVGAIWIAGLMYWGFRGPALIAAVIVYIIARKKGLKISKWVPLSAAVILLLILPLLRSARESPLNERFSQLSFKDVNLLDCPAEMGMSLRPLVESIDLIGPKDFRWGRTYWTGIKGIVPNLAIRWEAPATESDEDLPPSLWITAAAEPWLYKNYGGIGFSAIAEPYINFGISGVVFYFLLLAIFLTWLERLSLRDSYALAAWGLILGPLLWTTRNDFASFFRPAVWGLLTLAIVRALSKAYAQIFKHRSTAGLNSESVRVNHA